MCLNSKEVCMNYVSFNGCETSGSIGKRNLNVVRDGVGIVQTSPKSDTVSFRGRDDNDSSAGSVLFKALASIAVVVGGLGLAHKANLAGKFKNAKIKNIMNKANRITEPCYNICRKVKTLCLEGYGKFKGFFGKK